MQPNLKTTLTQLVVLKKRNVGSNNPCEYIIRSVQITLTYTITTHETKGMEIFKEILILALT
jgi:hypothetical protein